MVELGGSSLHEKDHESCLEDTFFTCNLFIPYVFHGCDFRVTLPRFHATRGSTMASSAWKGATFRVTDFIFCKTLS
jgi:hypothetical protein